MLQTNNSIEDSRVLIERLMHDCDRNNHLANNIGEKINAHAAGQIAQSNVSSATTGMLSMIPQLFNKRLRMVGGWVWAFLNLRTISRVSFTSNQSIGKLIDAISDIENISKNNQSRINILEELSPVNKIETQILLEGVRSYILDHITIQSKEIEDLRAYIATLEREIRFQQIRLGNLNNRSEKISRSQDFNTGRYDNVYIAFEEVFRGKEEDILNRLQQFSNFIDATGAGKGNEPLLDIGCGRGEWLQLLSNKGLNAYGIDANALMVERARSKGFNVLQIDLHSHLNGLPDNSVSGISAFHVIEHLSFDEIIDFLNEAFRVIISGGILILETPNPENIRVGATTFYLDPTHRNPLPPDTLNFLVNHCGFDDIELRRYHPNTEYEPSSDETMAKLNKLLYGPQDYAVLARKR